MGKICSKPAPHSSVEDRQDGEATRTRAAEEPPPLTNEKNEKKTRENELESIRTRFRGSIYYDALSNFNFDEQDDEEAAYKVAPLRYAPATAANPHPRASIAVDSDSTMLKKQQPPDISGSRPQVAASVVVMQDLKAPSVKLSMEGYPGDLTSKELEACRLFRQRLKQKNDPAYYDMVLALAPGEEEPYSICRFMRARDFDVDAVIEMMDECIGMWKDAAKHDFYPSVEDAVGCSEAVFNSQFPYIWSGLAKNGTVVIFLPASAMSVEGIECLTEVDRLSNYFWYTVKNKLAKTLISLQERNPHLVVRAEETFVIDLKNTTSSQFSKAAIDAVKNMFMPSGCFPEVLNKAVILNAPSFFSFIWRIAKVFLDPRTQQKVEIFSNAVKGEQRLKELMESNYIPSDYGGTSPSLDQIFQEQYCGAEGRSRQLHHLMTLVKKRKTDWKFTLNSNGECATVTIHSSSLSKADFVIKSGRSKSTIASGVVERNGEKGPYSRELAKIEGPGNFDISAQSPSPGTEYFLIMVSVVKK